MNAALNYGYGFLKILCRTAINSVGLEPAVGFLHETASAQTAESLVYDFEEPFRWLVDFCVIEAFETERLGFNDFAFTRDDYLYRIQWDGRMRLRECLVEAFNSGIPYKDRTLKWDTVIEQKALELSKYLSGKIEALDFSEPVPVLERTDSKALRERILSLTQSAASELGIGKVCFTIYVRKRENAVPLSFTNLLSESCCAVDLNLISVTLNLGDGNTVYGSS